MRSVTRRIVLASSALAFDGISATILLDLVSEIAGDEVQRDQGSWFQARISTRTRSSLAAIAAGNRP